MSEEKRAINIKFPEFDNSVENPYQEEMDKIIDVNLSEAKAKKETNAVPVDSDNIEPINPPEGGEQ